MNNFVIEDKDIEQLTRTLLAADSTSTVVRGTYFRSLIAMSQIKLGMDKPRNTKVTRYATLKPETRDAQLAALKEVHAHAYNIVLEVIGNDPDRNAKSVFARTAYSTLTAWVKVNGSLLDLNLADVSKNRVRQLTTKRQRPSASDPLPRAVANLVRLATATASESPKEAAEQLQAAMDAIGTAMIELGLTKVARSVETAGKRDLPFRMGELTMWPVHSQQQHPALAS